MASTGTTPARDCIASEAGVREASNSKRALTAATVGLVAIQSKTFRTATRMRTASGATPTDADVTAVDDRAPLLAEARHRIAASATALSAANRACSAAGSGSSAG